MKTIRIVIFTSLLAMALLLAGCQFEVALSEPMGLPIDESVLGTWTAVNEDGTVGRDPEQITLYKYTGLEYLVIHHGSDPMYFRAYPIQINGLSCVQMILLADPDEGPPSETDDPEDEKFYMVVQYTIEDGKLLVSTLNPKVINQKATSTAELRASVLMHIDDPELFETAYRYIR